MSDYIETNIAHYNANADQLAESYLSVSTEDSLPVFNQLIKGYQGEDCQALEIGCGAGGDAFWLSQKGWSVNAVDGSASFIEYARDRFHSPNLNFLLSAAPDFSELEQHDKVYNLILGAAFIFHFDALGRKKIYDRLKGMLAPSGLIHFTLRNGPIPQGRVMFPVVADELEMFAVDNRFSFKKHGEKIDFLGRMDVTWTHVSVWRGKEWDHAREIFL